MQINLDPSSLSKTINGNKTYIALAAGAAIIVLNHYGLLPPGYAPSGLNPNNWINDLYTLVIGATFRSAFKKMENPAPADPQKPQG